MRFFGLVFALLAAVALAQTAQNYINVPEGGFDVQAGQPITITWSNPSSGTVTIRLTQGENLTPGSGDVLIANVPASAEIATFTIPDGVNTGDYNFAIVDDTNDSNINFSSPFTIAGATASPSSASASASSASASATASLSSLSSSASSASASASASASSASASASASVSSARESASSSVSRASSSASAAATSVVASPNGGVAMGVSGVAALIAGAIAVF